MSQLFLLKNDANGNFFHQHHLLYNPFFDKVYFTIESLLSAHSTIPIVHSMSEFFEKFKYLHSADSVCGIKFVRHCLTFYHPKKFITTLTIISFSSGLDSARSSVIATKLLSEIIFSPFLNKRLF